MLFYSAWPLGYHNVEAERKAGGFAQDGYDVVYVAGIGIRNPRPYNLVKLRDRVGRFVRSGRDGEAGAPPPPGVRSAAVLVVPPRQLPPVRRRNAAWLERQLRRAIPDWSDAVAWIRWPTPELVDALSRLRPAATVYECVDAHHHGPGITGRWAEIHEAAERELVSLSGAVVVPGETLAERFRAWGADVRIVPHGVDLFDWREPQPRGGRPAVLGFVGTLDYRLDLAVLRRVAEAHADWRLRLIGPAQEGFEPGVLGDLPNVSFEPPVPHTRLGETLAGFDVGLMPYVDDDVYRAMTPVKTLELMAAGRPAVARPSPALEPYSDLLYLASDADRFVVQTERALAEDSAELARRRRAVAEEGTWDRRMAALEGVLDELLEFA